MNAASNGLTSVHFFNGGCGSLRGFADGGFKPQFGANHHPASVATARLNWPGLWVREAEVQNLDMNSVPRADVLEASPICTEASPASGKAAPRKPVELDSFGQPKPGAEWEMTRVTMFEPIRYASVHRPMVYAWENVPEFGFDPLFSAWNGFWKALEYTLVVASVNAAHLKVPGRKPLPQSRDRIVGAFVRNDIVEKYGLPDLNPTCDAVCRGCGPVEGVQSWKNEQEFRVGSYGRRRQYVYVCPACGDEVEPVTTGIGSVLDLSDPGEPFGLGYFRGKQRVKRTAYAESTRALVAEGLATFHGKPFIVTKRNHVRPKLLTEPIGTLSAQAGGHHYLAVPTAEMTVDSTLYRPLRIREKARCQGFDDDHLFAGEEPDQRLQIGNAVPVNVAYWHAQQIRACLPGGVRPVAETDVPALPSSSYEVAGEAAA